VGCMNSTTAAEQSFDHTAGNPESEVPQHVILTFLSRFVDGFISLDDVDESRTLNHDFGYLAHRDTLTRNSDINGCHSSVKHCGDL